MKEQPDRQTNARERGGGMVGGRQTDSLRSQELDKGYRLRNTELKFLLLRLHKTNKSIKSIFLSERQVCQDNRSSSQYFEDRHGELSSKNK